MFKNILVNVSRTEGHEERLKWALHFAKQHKANLKLVYIIIPASIPDVMAGRGASNAYLAEVMQIAREKEAIVHAEVEKICRKHKVSFTWELVEGDPIERMIYLSNLCDLCIFSQINPKHQPNKTLKNSPETLLFKSGATILMLPYGKKSRTIGEKIMICWKNSRGAIRAIRGASHLFPKARKIYVLTGTKTDPDGSQAREIMEYIKSRGAKAKTIEDMGNVDFSDGGGPTILRQAKKVSADLIVMGGYGQSKMREMILGGTTYHMFKNLDRPVMIAH